MMSNSDGIYDNRCKANPHLPEGYLKEPLQYNETTRSPLAPSTCGRS